MASALSSEIFFVPLTSSCRRTATYASPLSTCPSQFWVGSSFTFASRNSSLKSHYSSTNLRKEPYTSICIDKGSRRSRLIKGLVRAKLVRFSGRKEVSIPFQERSIPPGTYLKETERIVKVTFPDSTRIKYMGDSVWQARLQTITFFNFSATPCCDVRVAYDNEALYIDSNKLVLDVTGLPDQFRNMDLQLSLHGELRVYPRAASMKPSGGWDFGGWVDLGVGINLPLPLSLISDRLLTAVGDQIVDRILQAMEGALLRGIISDYNAWCSLSQRNSSSKQEPLPEANPRSAL